SSSGCCRYPPSFPTRRSSDLRLRLAYSKFSVRLAKLWNNKFYLYLAALFMLFAVLDTMQLHIISGMRQEAFDAMVRYRIIVPKPDRKSTRLNSSHVKISYAVF